MQTSIYQQQFIRELDTLSREIQAYPDEKQIWETPPGISNSAGTLALHLAGNLQHFIGAQLGNTGYIRDREAEFTDRNVPRSQILESIQAAKVAVKLTFEQIDEMRLKEIYPLSVANVNFHRCRSS